MNVGKAHNQPSGRFEFLVRLYCHLRCLEECGVPDDMQQASICITRELLGLIAY
jgi:hypothetical protein